MMRESLNKLCELLNDRVDEWEITGFEITTTEFEAKEGASETFSDGRHTGFSIRIIKDRKIGFSYATDEKQFKNIIEEAISLSKYKMEEDFSFYKNSNNRIERKKYYDKNFDKINRKVIEEAIKNAVNTSISFSKKVKKVRRSIFAKKMTKFHIMNSHGIDLFDERSDFYLMQEVIAEHDGDSTTSWAIDFSHFYNNIKPEVVGKESAENAVGLLGGRRLKTGEYPAVIKNLPASELLGVLGKSFLSEAIYKNKSQLKNRVNEKIFSEPLTIIDSGLISQGWNAFPFDGEGVIAQENILVERGELKGYLYDNYYGRIFKSKSTGNCRRDEYSVPPKQDITNLYIKPGKFTLEELIKNAGDGVMITGLMGVHTVNPVTGDFSLGAEGFYLRNGNLSEPFRGVTVSGNLFELFRNISEVGSDLRFLFSSGSPSLLIKKIMVGGN